MVEICNIKNAFDKLAKAVGFKCLGCAKCERVFNNKSMILLTIEEVERLKEKGKMYGVVPYKRINGFAGYLKFLGKNIHEEFKCVFLDKNNKCEIHEYKPLICYIHPFQVFTVGFVFGGGMIFDTKCSWVKKHRKKLDNPSKKILDAYNCLYSLVMKYKEKKTKLS